MFQCKKLIYACNTCSCCCCCCCCWCCCGCFCFCCCCCCCCRCCCCCSCSCSCSCYCGGCSRVVVPVGILHCKVVVPSTKNLWNRTCVYEGENVHMKQKRKGFWLKLMGGPLRKRLENHQRNNLCLWRGICAHEGEKKAFVTKTDRGSPSKTAEKSPKKQLAFMKGKMFTWRGKVSVCD